MMTVCAECGKRIVVTWPEFYVYKRGKGEDTCYFCSENCMIVSDVRDAKERSGWNDEPWITEGELEDIQAGRKPFRMLRRPTSRNSRPPAEKDRPEKPAERTGQDMGNNKSSHKLTREEKEKAVELAIAGKDPIGYLKECGAKNPWASWAYIKQTLKKAKPEKYAQLPGDDDRLGEEVSFGAQSAPEAKQAAPEAVEAVDPLEGFVAYDPGAPEGDKAADLVINAEDLAAAEDPAVKRMESFAMVETTDRVPPVACRLVMDEHGLHTVREKPEKPKDPEQDKAAEDAAGFRPEVMTFYGFPCEVTALKIDDFEFAKDGEGMRAILPGGTILWGSTVSTPAIMAAEQWKRLAEIIPKVMKILRIE